MPLKEEDRKLVNSRFLENFIKSDFLIGNPNAECLESARFSLTSVIDYAGLNFKSIHTVIFFFIYLISYKINLFLQDIIDNFNRISRGYFYPLIEILHYQSNQIQWEVLNVLGSFNPVTQMPQFINRLEDDYFIMVILYEMAIGEFKQKFNFFKILIKYQFFVVIF